MNAFEDIQLSTCDVATSGKVAVSVLYWCLIQTLCTRKYWVGVAASWLIEVVDISRNTIWWTTEDVRNTFPAKLLRQLVRSTDIGESP